MIKDSVKIKGQPTVTLYDKDGNIKDRETIHNLVVDTGLAWMAARWLADGNIPGAMTHMAIGDGDVSAPAAGDTTLESELGRAALDSITNANNVTTFTATFDPGVGTGAVVEAGIFDSAAGGTMLARTTFAVKNKGADDTIVIEWAGTQN